MDIIGFETAQSIRDGKSSSAPIVPQADLSKRCYLLNWMQVLVHGTRERNPGWSDTSTLVLTTL